MQDWICDTMIVAKKHYTLPESYRILVEGVPEEDAFAEMRRYRFRENPEKPLYPYLRQYLKSRSAEAQEP